MADATLQNRTMRGARGRRVGQTRLNTGLSWFLLTLIALAPLPLGSARPLAWGLWAVVLGLGGIVYLWLLRSQDERLRVPLENLRLPGLLMATTLIYLIVQMLPIPTSVPLPDGSALQLGQISLAPNMTALMLVRQATFALLFMLTLQICVNDDRRMRFLNLLLIIIIAYAAYGEIALQTGDSILGLPKWAYQGSATGPFVNRNSFATFLAFGSVLSLALVGGTLLRQFTRHKDDGHVPGTTSRVVLYGMAYVFLLVVIMATRSRMGVASALIGSAFVVVVIAASLGKMRILAYLLPLMAIAIVLGIALFGEGLFERFEGLNRGPESRFPLFAETWDLIAIRPWLGFGGGSYGVAYPLVHTPAVDIDFSWDRAHNTYLSLWSELGLIVGSLPVIALLLLGLRLTLALVRRQGSFTATCAALGVLVVGGVHSLTDFSLEIQANTFVFVALVAAGMAPLLGRSASRSY